jgi:hypothetical protein
MYTLNKVTLDLLNKRYIDAFTFAYMKEVKITSYDSPSLAFRVSESTSLWPRKVNVIGQHFIPVQDQLFCKVGFENDPYEVPGTYVNNHTISCDIRAPYKTAEQELLKT